MNDKGLETKKARPGPKSHFHQAEINSKTEN
jgi:hypothetical protein